VTAAETRRPVLTNTQRRAVWHGLALAGLVFNATLLLFWSQDLFLWIDATAWRSLDVADPYAAANGAIDTIGAFIYPPPAVFLFAPLAWLPWAVFAPLFLGLNLAAVVLLTGRWSPVALVAFPPVLLELLNGNIHLLMAAAIWLGFRFPVAWAFVLLTKVTPGIGVLWFAARGEWRSFVTAVLATGAICVTTLVLVPNLWAEWISLVSGAAPVASALPSLPIRLVIAAALVLFAARTDRAWLVPLASLIAMPTVWLQSTAILTACFPLYWERERFQTRARATRSSVQPTTIVGATQSEGHA
jgi:Glycosyltransferase family 87